MLMLCSKCLVPCECFSLESVKKFGEMKVLRSCKLLRSFLKIVMHFCLGGGGGAVYNCNVGVKLLGEKNFKQSHIINTIFSF